MSCCPVVMEPSLASAGGQGVAKTFNGTSLFVTGPATATAGVLAFPDIFGVDSGRIKQDAEALGKLGYAVAVVDLTDGEWIVDPSDAPRKAAWLEKHAFAGTTGKRLRDAIEYLQTEAGATSISSYGYCWGAYIGAAQSATAVPVLKGHVSFHPSWKVADVVSGEGGVDKMAQQITQVPQLLLSAGNDLENVREGGSVQRILKAQPGVVGELSDVVDFPDVVHGWVNRGDLADETIKKSVMKAWHAAVKFTQTVNPL
jgi:dienelactone hydrolase